MWNAYAQMSNEDDPWYTHMIYAMHTIAQTYIKYTTYLQEKQRRLKQSYQFEDLGNNLLYTKQLVNANKSSKRKLRSTIENWILFPLHVLKALSYTPSQDIRWTSIENVLISLIFIIIISRWLVTPLLHQMSWFNIW